MCQTPRVRSGAMTTTIRINGEDGARFLSILGQFDEELPAALEWLYVRFRAGDSTYVDLDPHEADAVAAFIDELIDSGRLPDLTAPPLLFSPQVGDRVVIVRDALVEFQVGKREGRTWRYVPQGTRGELVRRNGGLGKIYVREGQFAREHLWVADRSMTRLRSGASFRA